jgi:hypothetical protein
VEWLAYEGSYPWVPDFELLPPVAHGTEPRPDLNPRPGDHDTGRLFQGYFNIPRDGDYTFHLEADGGALLRIHDATVIDADFGHAGGEERSGSIRLQAGLHPFRLHYVRGTKGAPSLKISWSGPGIAKEAIPDAVFQRGTGS